MHHPLMPPGGTRLCTARGWTRGGIRPGSPAVGSALRVGSAWLQHRPSGPGFNTVPMDVYRMLAFWCNYNSTRSATALCPSPYLVGLLYCLGSSQAGGGLPAAWAALPAIARHACRSRGPAGWRIFEESARPWALPLESSIPSDNSHRSQMHW